MPRFEIVIQIDSVPIVKFMRCLKTLGYLILDCKMPQPSILGFLCMFGTNSHRALRHAAAPNSPISSVVAGIVARPNSH